MGQIVKFLVSSNDMKHQAINHKLMSICRILGYIYFPIFENALTKFQNDASR
jgi:hypothetical protein